VAHHQEQPASERHVHVRARLTTQGRFSFTYGRMRARLRLPYEHGVWPALWLLGESVASVSWPACGEIDVMELFGTRYG
jgi:beta-glucanase (GH16 family)